MSNLLSDVHVERRDAELAVVTFAGEHDFTTKQEISELLDELVRTHRTVIVNFSRAEFVDAAVVGVLRMINRAAGAYGNAFRLQLGTAPIVERIFEVSGVLAELDWIPVHEDGPAGSRVSRRVASAASTGGGRGHNGEEE